MRMTPFLLLLCPLLALLLAACAGPYPSRYEQAVRPLPRPVAPPPALTPGYNPNTPPPPEYAPAGAGASHGGIVTTPEGRTVPRSKGRILPPSSEPGLWAADGAPRASADTMPTIFDIAFPYPASATTPDARRWSDVCGTTMDETAKRLGTHDEFMQADRVNRMCLAAEAYHACAKGLGRLLATPTPRVVRDMQAHGAHLVDHNCKNRDVVAPYAKTLVELFRKWEEGIRERLKSIPTQ